MWVLIYAYMSEAGRSPCVKSTTGFTVKNKDVEFSKKRPCTAVNGNEESDAEEQYESTKNCIYYNKKEEDVKDHESGEFSKFRLSQEAIELLQGKNINYLFPIQSETFDYIYDGEDIIAQARTGTGKTLAFVLPLIEKLKLENQSDSRRGRAPKVVILTPTRELAKQIGDEFDYFKSNLDVLCVYGGVSYGPQAAAIRNGLDVVVGTPGRIIDHMVNGTLDLKQLKHVVIDEVDRMLDMGFSDSVEDIIQESYSGSREGDKPQTLLFSATLPSWVVKTAKKYMSDSRKIVDLIGDQELKASETVQHLAIRCPYEARASMLSDVVQVYCGAHSRTLIFTETKNEASSLALNSILKQDTHVLHGDIAQEQREITLKSFRDGKVRCLVATDVAARGLDIPEVDLVVQVEPPRDLDTYIHRSGRTGRAGRDGISILFYKSSQETDLRAVERRAGVKFKHIAAPSTGDIIQASAMDAEKFIQAVAPDVLEKFRESAQALVDKLGAVDAVAASLAHISGTKEIKARSLLTGREDCTTYIMRAQVEMYGTGYIRRALEQLPEVKERVQVMRLCQDKQSVVFDVPNDLCKQLESYWTGHRITLEKITELPELAERPQHMSGNRQSSGGRFDRGGNNYQRDDNRRGYNGKDSFKRDRNGGRDSYRRDFDSNGYNERRKSDVSYRDGKKNFDNDFDDGDWLNRLE
ncbi:Nucleolar RNA helicase 2 [Desmophyllum pertusum]|uniref:RNA helicase n=1 Tax=Desmophyllum pertusum TaxID=174260 RepID=A0A9W9YBR4_9CNID|nr:Nucleolar RNA helicase 2 [Desmophyllum pertusum]